MVYGSQIRGQAYHKVMEDIQVCFCKKNVKDYQNRLPIMQQLGHGSDFHLKDTIITKVLNTGWKFLKCWIQDMFLKNYSCLKDLGDIS